MSLYCQSLFLHTFSLANYMELSGFFFNSNLESFIEAPLAVVLCHAAGMTCVYYSLMPQPCIQPCSNCLLSRSHLLNVTHLAPPHCVLQLHLSFLHLFICHDLHSSPVCCWNCQNTLTLVGHSANHHKKCSQYLSLTWLFKTKQKKRDEASDRFIYSM